MNERMAQELRLLRTRFPNLDYRDDGQWVLLPGWRVPTTLWDHKHIDICFQIPGGLPGTEALWVLRLATNSTPRRTPPQQLH